MSFMSIVGATAVIMAVLHSSDDVKENSAKPKINGEMKTSKHPNLTNSEISKKNSVEPKTQKFIVQKLALKEIKIPQAEGKKVGDLAKFKHQLQIKRPKIAKSIQRPSVSALWDKDSEGSDDWIK